MTELKRSILKSLQGIEPNADESEIGCVVSFPYISDEEYNFSGPNRLIFSPNSFLR